jgi:RNA polymerase sigma factor (sigma-70 family)
MVIRRRRHPYAEVSFTPPSESAAGFQEFDTLDSALTPEEICDLKQRFDRMRSAVDRLDPKSRTAIGIWLTQECTMKELAHALDVSLATVKTRLHRARKRLARSVDHKHQRTLSQKHGDFEFRPAQRYA